MCHPGAAAPVARPNARDTLRFSGFGPAPGPGSTCDDEPMSYDLAVWDGERPPDDRQAGSVYDELFARYLETDDTVPPSARVVEYVAALLGRYPDDPGGSSVWASPPVMDEASGPIVYLVMSYGAAGEVSAYAAALAAGHGLVCFDPQGECLRP
jgi:hypothetical protein